jgi:hypothetical protein
MLGNGPGPRLIDLGNPVAWDHPLNRGLLHWWLPLPNNHGATRCHDIAGDRTGTLSSGMTWGGTGRPGAVGRSIVGASTHNVDCGRVTALDGAAYVYTSGWMYRAASGQIAGFGRLDSTNRRVGFIWFSDNNVYFCADTGAAAATRSVAFNVTGWHFFELVFDGSLVGTARLAAWIDGAAITGSTSGTPPATLPSSADVWRFNRSNNSSTNLVGSYDDIRISTAPRDAALYDQSRRGHPDLLRRYTPRTWYFGRASAGGGGDVSVALTGQSLTASAGTLTPATSVPLTGSALAASAGTLAPALSVALSGSGLTASTGTLTVSNSVALSGSSLTAAPGTLAPALSVALTGAALSIVAGTLTATGGDAGNVTVALTGQSLTISAGTLAPETSVALTGSGLTAATGTLTPDLAVAMAGAALSVVAGTLTASGGSPLVPVPLFIIRIPAADSSRLAVPAADASVVPVPVRLQ